MILFKKVNKVNESLPPFTKKYHFSYEKTGLML
jgi:hypothetical protein